MLKKRLRHTVPRDYITEVMKKHENEYLQINEIYLNLEEGKKVTLSVVYRVARDLYDAGILERKWNEKNGKLSYRYRS